MLHRLAAVTRRAEGLQVAPSIPSTIMPTQFVIDVAGKAATLRTIGIGREVGRSVALPIASVPLRCGTGPLRCDSLMRRTPHPTKHQRRAPWFSTDGRSSDRQRLYSRAEKGPGRACGATGDSSKNYSKNTRLLVLALGIGLLYGWQPPTRIVTISRGDLQE